MAGCGHTMLQAWQNLCQASSRFETNDWSFKQFCIGQTCLYPCTTIWLSHLLRVQKLKSYLRGRSRRIVAQGQPRQKLARPFLKKMPPVLVCACNPSYLGSRGRMVTVRGRSRQKHKILREKQTESKRIGGMGQVTVALSSKWRPCVQSPVPSKINNE
jgi:hypothetical protein